MENDQVSLRGKRGNNIFGSKGGSKCHQCRRRKGKCVYDDPKLPCDYCVSRGSSCGEKFSADHRRSLRRLNDAPFVAHQLRIVEQGHQRFAWLNQPRQPGGHPVNQSMGEQNRLKLPSSASVNDEVMLMIMNHFSSADPATVKAIVTEEVKSFEEKGGLETSVGIFAPQNPSPRSQVNLGNPQGSIGQHLSQPHERSPDVFSTSPIFEPQNLIPRSQVNLGNPQGSIGQHLSQHHERSPDVYSTSLFSYHKGWSDSLSPWKESGGDPQSDDFNYSEYLRSPGGG